MAGDATQAHGWSNPATARRYAEFCRAHQMYWATSRDLVKLAGISGDVTVVDLCCGTGVTTTTILEALGPGGTVVAVDSSAAMLAEARAFVDDGRVRWVESKAEQLAEHAADADAVICNSAIWQTDMAATFGAIASVLDVGGRFVGNIGRQFMIMPFTDDELEPAGPGLFELMNAFAVIDHDYAARRAMRGGPPLRAEGVTAMLEAAGLADVSSQEFSYADTLERSRDWLAIPIFTERLLPGLTYEQRMDCLAKAYERVDPATITPSRWMAFVATRM